MIVWFVSIWYDNNSSEVNFYLPVLRNAKTFVVVCFSSYMLITSLKWDWPLLTHHWAYIYLNIMSMLLSERVSERTSASVYLAVWLKCRTVYDDQQHCNKSKILLRYSGWLKVGQFYFLLCLCVYKYVRTRHFKLTAIIILDFTGSLLTSSRKIIKTIFWL